ncbi:MAG: GGDEF domain-containing protein [Deltaproteobacteria bacterium]|nr:GGDEF domain-containing protein [Deltaproteobacteria bacterium]MBW2017804.1 GGDEF domain-containing protein [Deltaproteobacteria bacterium]MBW2130523.1 GGDEF domain-containing protein [Deltaproteobacteria bacterium]MBW2305109.1 GGDEF domain-containing protein [Deltaproteobacteria bacterium]
MEKDYKGKFKRLKKEYLESERINQEEKECLLRVINTYGTVVAMHEEMAEELETLQKMLDIEKALPIDLIEVELGKLKDKIIAAESTEVRGAVDPAVVAELQAIVLEACRTLRNTMNALMEDFYPLTEELARRATAIDIKCTDEMEKSEFVRTGRAFLEFVDGLKQKVSEDIKYITHAFVTLLDHVKDLEKALSREFGVEQNLKRIEYFEMQVNSEVGSIVDSFNIYRTIDEIKTTVISKIKNIKRLITKKKEEDIRRAKVAQENIEKLKSQIAAAEKSMQQLSQKAQQFQAAAEMDSLTEVHNRKAFDKKIKEALDRFHEDGIPICAIFFDVDNFKEINDTLGHVAGDKVLQKVAQCLVRSFRKGDFVARFGGDEFVVLIERLTMEMAKERILTFRKNLAKIRFTSYAKGDIPITVSAGISLARKGDTVESLIARADKVMYNQKQKKKGALKK